MKILAQRPTHISAVATVLLITKTFPVKHREREREREGGEGGGGKGTGINNYTKSYAAVSSFVLTLHVFKYFLTETKGRKQEKPTRELFDVCKMGQFHT